MKNINLIPMSYYNKQRFRAFIYKMVAIEATIFLITVLFVSLIYYTIKVKSNELETLVELAEDEKFTHSNKVKELIIEKQNQIEIYNEITALFGKELGAEGKINIIMENILDDVEVLELSYNRTYKRIVIITQTENKNSIPIFIDNLNNINLFTNIYILNSSNNSNGTIFTIEIFINS